jgi:hypothetical protein
LETPVSLSSLNLLQLALVQNNEPLLSYLLQSYKYISSVTRQPKNLDHRLAKEVGGVALRSAFLVAEEAFFFLWNFSQDLFTIGDLIDLVKISSRKEG